MSKQYNVLQSFSTLTARGKLTGKPHQKLTVGGDLSQATADRLDTQGYIKEIKPRKKAAGV